MVLKCLFLGVGEKRRCMNNGVGGERWADAKKNNNKTSSYPLNPME